MERDFSELIEYLDKKFANIDGQLSDLKENKADKSDMNNLTNAVDSFAKKVSTKSQEETMLTHKVDRHEKWAHRFADKLGVKLEY